MRRTRSTILMAAGLSVVLAACGGGGSASPSTVPPTSTPPATVAASSSSSSVAVTSTTQVPNVAPAVTLPASVVGLSPDGPWRLVDSAPGITTPGLVYELMPKLWVYLPLEEDLEHGITWTFNEDDRPIIEAYLQAQLTYFLAVTADPIDLDSPRWDEWYVDGGASYSEILRQRSEQGATADLDAGVVLRPQVIGDERTDSEAIAFDCMLDGGVFRLPDGTLAPGSTAGVAAQGVAMRLRRAASHWVVAQVGRQPEACA